MPRRSRERLRAALATGGDTEVKHEIAFAGGPTDIALGEDRAG